jgi:hypothetical protein
MSRETVLASIKSALAQNPSDARQGESTLRERLHNPRISPRPELPADTEREFFRRLELVQTSIELLTNINAVPDVVARWRAVVQPDGAIAVAPSLAHLDWSAFDAISFDRAQGVHAFGVSTCIAGIAETGGLVLTGSADTPATLAFLPEFHIVVMRRDQLVAHIEDVWPILRASNVPLPRAVNINTGPSRTADIEQTLEIGAHGPRRMHVLYLQDSETV